MLLVSAIAAAAVFWLLMCFFKFIQKGLVHNWNTIILHNGFFRAPLKKITEFFKSVWNTPWTKDFLGSMMVLPFAIFLPGVTGMLVGLFSSVMWSIACRLGIFKLDFK